MITFQCLNRSCNFEQNYPNDDEPFICPECKGKWYRLRFGLKQENKGVNWYEKDNPRYSEALGVNPDQIPQFKKEFGDLMEFDKEGRCLVKNRHHKKQLMRTRGYVETE